MYYVYGFSCGLWTQGWWVEDGGGGWGVSEIKKLRERKGVKKKCERKYNGRIVGMDISTEKTAIYRI